MPKIRSGRNIHGILLLDKRAGISSNRALQEVKRTFKANKAGHTGSLDPLATGLLPICFGEATKVSGLLLDDNKRYVTQILLGVTTDTGDLEGEITSQQAVKAYSDTDIGQALSHFKGYITQIPPMYSALKHQGKKLYELAREGKHVERAARNVKIFDLNLLSRSEDTLTLDVHCSKGTYIRTLAEDIGKLLCCGATVKSLRRIEVGVFGIDQALTYEELLTLSESDLFKRLIHVDEPLQNLPAVYLDRCQSEKIRQGQLLNLEKNMTGITRIYCETDFLGLGEIRLDGKLAPKKIFNLYN
jgi:tRNA pseudouridine55 synthase